MLNFDRSSIKHVLQNTQNDCHQWPSDSSRVHQICFRPGLPWTGPRWGSLQRSPRPLPSWFKGSLLLRGGKGRVGKGTRGEGARERDGEGREETEREGWKGREWDKHPLHQLLHTPLTEVVGITVLSSGFYAHFFTALHVMQTRYSDENSVRLSVRPSVRLSHACIVTKRKKDLSTFLHHTKDNLA